MSQRDHLAEFRELTDLSERLHALEVKITEISCQQQKIFRGIAHIMNAIQARLPRKRIAPPPLKKKEKSYGPRPEGEPAC